MKIKIGLLTLGMCGRLLGQVDAEGVVTDVDFDDNLILAYEYYAGAISYTNGGLTVDLSAGGFTAIPTVVVSVQPASYDGSTTYDAQISALSATSVTIYVLQTVDGVVTEAADNAVTLQIIVNGEQVTSID